jgi:hypothetical protein
LAGGLPGAALYGDVNLFRLVNHLDGLFLNFFGNLN